MTRAAVTHRPPWVRRMVSRDSTTSHRPSTNLELLFDLTFVVAVASVARELAHSLTEGHYLHGTTSYFMVFFAIWWAWVNFTWFASAYDTDDVPYRLLTLVQMGGVLVLAAGVARAFEGNDFVTITVGYLIMRLAMVGQWLRAAFSDAEHRETCLRYAAGITVVQLGWVVRLWLPGSTGRWSFVVLAVAEVLVPVVAERTGMTTWHPDHIAERYGLFTIIVLGECMTQAGGALQNAYTDSGVSVRLVVTAMSALILLFGLWWLYFVVPPGEHLRRRPGRSFAWGYGHLIVFSSLAAVAAGLDVGLVSLTGHLEISRTAVALTVAVPVAIFLLIDAAISRALATADGPHVAVVGAAATLSVAAAFTGHWWPTPAVQVLVTLPVVLLVVHSVVSTRPRVPAQVPS